MKNRLHSFAFTFFVSLHCLVVSCPTCIEQMDATTPALFSKEYEKEYARHDDGTLAIQAKEHAHEQDKQKQNRAS